MDTHLYPNIIYLVILIILLMTKRYIIAINDSDSLIYLYCDSNIYVILHTFRAICRNIRYFYWLDALGFALVHPNVFSLEATRSKT